MSEPLRQKLRRWRKAKGRRRAATNVARKSRRKNQVLRAVRLSMNNMGVIHGSSASHGSDQFRGVAWKSCQGALTGS